MEDTSIQPLGMSIISPEDGVEGDFLQLVIIRGLPLPFADPSTGEPVVVPIGQYRVPLDRDFALKLADKLKEEAEKLPERPKNNIQIASSLTGVDQLADFERRLR